MDPIQIRRTILSPRQYQIAEMVADGLSNKEIAAQLGIKEATVKNTLTVAFAKLGMVPKANKPAELAALIKTEAAIWGPIIRSTGFKPLE